MNQLTNIVNLRDRPVDIAVPNVNPLRADLSDEEIAALVGEATRHCDLLNC